MPKRIDKFTFYDVVIYAARGSSGARRLATALGARRWRDDLPERYTRRRPYFRGNSSPLVVNWGSTAHPKWLEDRRFQLSPRFANHADHVAAAINKLTFFQLASRIDGVPLLPWTDSKDEALAWIGKGKPAVCRTRLDGSSGRGITLARTAEELVDAPLYTRYYPKTHEFRVHVFDGNVIDLTQKKLKGADNGDTGSRFIRSLDNGWVHAHSDICLLDSGKDTISKACVVLVAGMGLTFGAVDVMAILEGNTDGGRALKSFKICEVNTGPGLENTITIEAYKKAILKYKSGEVVDAENSVEGVSGDQPESSVLGIL